MIFKIKIGTIERTGRIDDRLMDLQLITVNDYACKAKLNKRVYEKFLERRRPKSNEIPIAIFEKEIEETISKYLREEGGLSEEDS